MRRDGIVNVSIDQKGRLLIDHFPGYDLAQAVVLPFNLRSNSR